MIIIGLTIASCVVVGLVGLGLLHLVRHRSLRDQLIIVTLLPVLAVVATVLINVQLMFLSGHDSLVILVALLTSVLLAVVGALLVVRRIARASREVGAGLHQLVSDSSAGPPSTTAPATDPRGAAIRGAAGIRPGAARPGRDPAYPRRIPGAGARGRTLPAGAGQLHVP